MRSIYVLIVTAILFVCAAFAVSAQSESENSGLLIAEDVFDVMVEVSYNIGDQVVRARVPAQLVIDTTDVVSSVVAHQGSTVGIFGFEIDEMIETGEEFQYSQYGTFREPSTGNKLVVVSVKVTNLWNETVEGWSLSAEGVDSFGNRYDHEHKHCDELHPGASGQCLFGFEVAEDVELVTMDVSADDHKQFSLPDSAE